MADETSVVDKYQYTFVAKLLKVKIPLMWFRELYLSLQATPTPRWNMMWECKSQFHRDFYASKGRRKPEKNGMHTFQLINI